MSDTLRERHVFRDPETELNPEKREILRRRISNYAIQSATQFMLDYAPLPFNVNNRVRREFTHLPALREDVIEMADRFNFVADFAAENPRYFERAAVSKDTFEHLHAELEATAQRIDPLRTIRFIA